MALKAVLVKFSFSEKVTKICGFDISLVNAKTISRDVTTGATSATEVAPKFSDNLTLSQPRGGRFCPPLQRSQLKFSCGYVPDIYQLSLDSSIYILIFFSGTNIDKH